MTEENYPVTVPVAGDEVPVTDDDDGVYERVDESISLEVGGKISIHRVTPLDAMESMDPREREREIKEWLDSRSPPETHIDDGRYESVDGFINLEAGGRISLRWFRRLDPVESRKRERRVEEWLE